MNKHGSKISCRCTLTGAVKALMPDTNDGGVACITDDTCVHHGRDSYRRATSRTGRRAGRAYIMWLLEGRRNGQGPCGGCLLSCHAMAHIVDEAMNIGRLAPIKALRALCVGVKKDL
jgi:hypothetical protein